MLEFKEILLEDKSWIDELLRYSDERSTENNFTALYLWRKVYGTEVARWKDRLLVRSSYSHPEYGTGYYYLYPAGRGDAGEAIERMREDARSLGVPFRMNSVLKHQKLQLEEWYPDGFEYVPVRDSFDYLYRAEDLISLRGKKFQPKRNHISFFKKQPGWSYEAIGEENISDCLEMNAEWCRINGCRQDPSMAQEACSVRMALREFGALGLSGGLLRLEGRTVAFTVGERMNSDTMLIHIEKAFSDVRGAYPAISQEYLLHSMAHPAAEGAEITPEQIGFSFVNREDDAGDEGLRKAKLQYHPYCLIEKFLVSEK